MSHINKIYVKQTASKKRQNLSSTLCLKIMKKEIINYFYPTTTEQEQSRERSYNNIFNCLQHYRMKNARSCVKRCSFTQNLAKTFVEWGHKIKFPEFNINRKTIFFVKN